MNTVYIGLGSNLGDRKGFLDEALSRLEKHRKITIEEVSSIYETKPVGYDNQDDFLNMVICLRTSLGHIELLDVCQEIENDLGRERTIENGPRTIDLDILMYNNENRELDRLRIPHPRLNKRAFVLIPLFEIAPALVLPTTGETIEDVLLDIPDKEKAEVVLWSNQDN